MSNVACHSPFYVEGCAVIKNMFGGNGAELALQKAEALKGMDHLWIDVLGCMKKNTIDKAIGYFPKYKNAMCVLDDCIDFCFWIAIELCDRLFFEQTINISQDTFLSTSKSIELDRKEGIDRDFDIVLSKHGDLLELLEFLNEYLYFFTSEQIGKAIPIKDEEEMSDVSTFVDSTVSAGETAFLEVWRIVISQQESDEMAKNFAI